MVLASAFSCVEPAYVRPEGTGEDVFDDCRPTQSPTRLRTTRSAPQPKGVSMRHVYGAPGAGKARCGEARRGGRRRTGERRCVCGRRPRRGRRARCRLPLPPSHHPSGLPDSPSCPAAPVGRAPAAALPLRSRQPRPTSRPAARAAPRRAPAPARRRLRAPTPRPTPSFHARHRRGTLMSAGFAWTPRGRTHRWTGRVRAPAASTPCAWRAGSCTQPAESEWRQRDTAPGPGGRVGPAAWPGHTWAAACTQPP
jgi:hypothetical protein